MFDSDRTISLKIEYPKQLSSNDAREIEMKAGQKGTKGITVLLFNDDSSCAFSFGFKDFKDIANLDVVLGQSIPQARTISSQKLLSLALDHLNLEEIKRRRDGGALL